LIYGAVQLLCRRTPPLAHAHFGERKEPICISRTVLPTYKMPTTVLSTLFENAKTDVDLYNSLFKAIENGAINGVADLLATLEDKTWSEGDATAIEFGMLDTYCEFLDLPFQYCELVIATSKWLDDFILDVHENVSKKMIPGWLVDDKVPYTTPKSLSKHVKRQTLLAGKLYMQMQLSTMYEEITLKLKDLLASSEQSAQDAIHADEASLSQLGRIVDSQLEAACNRLNFIESREMDDKDVKFLEASWEAEALGFGLGADDAAMFTKTDEKGFPNIGDVDKALHWDMHEARASEVETIYDAIDFFVDGQALLIDNILLKYNTRLEINSTVDPAGILDFLCQWLL
jgi:hypothetical protein